MNLKIPKEIKFSNYYKKFNFLSFILILSSIVLLFIKGLNFGVDFKGGTLIEVRVENSKVGIADIRQSLLNMNFFTQSCFYSFPIDIHPCVDILNP